MRRPGVGVNRREGFRGYGGGPATAPAWTPSTGGAIVDLVADSAHLTTVSGKVSLWTDRSSFGNSPSQSTSGLRPTIENLAGGSGKQAVRFTAASATRLTLAALSGVGLGSTKPAVTIGWALETVADPALNAFGNMWAMDLNVLSAFWFSTNARAESYVGGATGPLLSAVDGPLERHRYISHRSSADPGVVTFIRDGVPSATGSTAHTAMSTATPAVWLGANVTGVSPSDIRLRAFCVFPTELGTADLATLDAYLVSVMA